MNSAGYPITSNSITTLDSLISEEKIFNKNSLTKTSIIYPILTLSTGISLMMMEHFSIIPDSNSALGISINLSIGITSAALTLVTGKENFKNAWQARYHPSAGAMDTLITLGTSSAFIFSFLSLGNTYFLNAPNSATFFSVPLVILGFLKISHHIRNQIHDMIENQIDQIDIQKSLLPKVAQVYLENEEKVPQSNEHKIIPGKLEQFFVSQIKQGSMIYVSYNNIVPIDGVLFKNDQVALQENFFGKKGVQIKSNNSIIYAGSISKNPAPFLLKTICEAENNHITRAYNSVKMHESLVENSLERVSQYFLRGVLGVALASTTGWLIWGPSLSHAGQVFLSVLLSACPCAFGLINVGSSISKGLAVEAGILIQNDRALSIDQATDICIDKCGTLTMGDYSFKDIVSVDEVLNTEQQKEWLAYAIALENQIDQKFQTAVAKAVIQATRQSQWELNEKKMHCTKFLDNPVNKGRGGIAVINEREVILGNKSLLKQQGIAVSQNWIELEKKHISTGKLPIFFAIDKKIRCLLLLEPQEEKQQWLRPDTQRVIELLLQNNRRIHFLTGDSLERTQDLMNQFPQTQIIVQTDQTPQSKVNYIKNLQNQGKQIIMIGDDYNDLGAVKQANFGVAIDSLAPIRSCSDVVLNGSLKGLIQLMRLAKVNRRGDHFSLFWAFGINSAAIVSATGIFYPWTHQLIDPVITGAAMSLSSLMLIVNIMIFKKIAAKEIKDDNFSKKINGPTKKDPTSLLALTHSSIFRLKPSTFRTSDRAWRKGIQCISAVLRKKI